MKIIQSILIWISIIPLAILNGGLRDKIIAPVLGNKIALPLSGVILCVAIFFVTLIFLPKLKRGTMREYVLMGIVWLLLTNLFDLLMIAVEGRALTEYFAMFDVSTGNLWGLVVLTVLLAPVSVAKIKKLIVER
jgi:hypothetical protein